MRAPGPVRLSLLSDRRDHPARGLLGGGRGAPAVIEFDDGTRPHPKSRTTVAPGHAAAHALCRRRRLWRSAARATRRRCEDDLRDGYITADGGARALRGGVSAMTRTVARIGVDVGGTFTDFVLHDPRRELVATGKRLTTPDDPSEAIIAGIAPPAGRGRPDARPICTASCTAPRW